MKLIHSIILTLIVTIHTASASAERPNFVFFIIDDAYREMLNYAAEGKGKNYTPHMDRLVRQGTVLSNQKIPSSVCTPSRFSCLTGLFASRSSIAQNDPLCRQANMTLVAWTTMIDKNTPTLPKKLQRAGYFTGMSGKCHFLWIPGMKRYNGATDTNDPIVREHLEHNYQRGISAVKETGFDSVESFYVYGQVHDHPIPSLREHNSDWIASGAINLIDQALAEDKPFYLYVATTLPHTPYPDDVSWNADPRVTPRGLLDEPCVVLPSRSTIAQRMESAGIPFSTKKAMMVTIDDTLGLLVDKLEVTGQLDNTVIFFFNDNGQEGKGTVYEGGLSSPSFIWKAGGFAAGAEVDALVSNIDFAPTIMDMAGIDYESDEFDGISLVPLLKGSVNEVRNSSYGEMGYARTVRKGDWKYIAVRHPKNASEIPSFYFEVPGDPTFGELPTFGQMAVRPNNPKNAMDLYGMRKNAAKRYPGYWDADQLYNLSTDPREQNNVADDPANVEILKALKEELRKYCARIPGDFGEFTE